MACRGGEEVNPRRITRPSALPYDNVKIQPLLAAGIEVHTEAVASCRKVSQWRGEALPVNQIEAKELPRPATYYQCPVVGNIEFADLPERVPSDFEGSLAPAAEHRSGLAIVRIG